MIFIANGMDASANNLGKVSLKTIEKVSESTLELLAVYNRDYTDEQIIAMDDFLEEFESIRSKVKCLVLPFLAKDDATATSFGETITPMYDIIRKSNTGMNAAAPNGAKYCIQDGGVVYSGDTLSTSGTYLQNSFIPENFDEYGIGIYGTMQAMKEFEFWTVIRKTQFWNSAGIFQPTGLIEGMPALKGSHLSMFRWSDSDNIIEGIVDGEVKASHTVSDLTKPTSIDFSNAIYPRLSTTPIKVITQYYGMTEAEVISYSKMLMRLMSSFGVND